uniref:Uncharacterized protein n=1 Tax=Plectus sambesii TaxID=2011161 RepID=A0A914W378_9BILA
MALLMTLSTSSLAARSLVVLLFIAAVDAQWDPTSRDFTAVCMKMANMGKDYCESFNFCCSEDNKLNKLNGDRCQTPDPINVCEGDGVGGVLRAHCRAHNCTAEITTTTTTTEAPDDAAKSASKAGVFSGFAAILLVGVVLQRALCPGGEKHST